MIRNSKLVFGDCSTVIYEAAFLKKPIRFFNSWMLEKYYEFLNIRTFLELEKLLNQNDFHVEEETLKEIYLTFGVGLISERETFQFTKLKNAFYCEFYNGEPQKLNFLLKLCKKISFYFRKKQLKIKKI